MSSHFYIKYTNIVTVWIYSYYTAFIATGSISITATAAVARKKKSKETRLTVLVLFHIFLIDFFLQSSNTFNT
jgi:hypothetical protein